MSVLFAPDKRKIQMLKEQEGASRDDADYVGESR